MILIDQIQNHLKDSPDPVYTNYYNDVVAQVWMAIKAHQTWASWQAPDSFGSSDLLAVGKMLERAGLTVAYHYRDRKLGLSGWKSFILRPGSSSESSMSRPIPPQNELVSKAGETREVQPENSVHNGSEILTKVNPSSVFHQALDEKLSDNFFAALRATIQNVVAARKLNNHHLRMGIPGYITEQELKTLQEFFIRDLDLDFSFLHLGIIISGWKID